MLVNDTRVILAGVDVSYVSLDITSEKLQVIIKYSEFFKDFHRKIKHKDIKSILKFEAIPVMVVTKHPEQGNFIDYNNGIVIFEGLVTAMAHNQIKGTDTYSIAIEALRLSIAVLKSIKYTSINIGTAFAGLNEMQNYRVSKVSSDTNAESKVVETINQGGLRNTDQIFIKRLLVGTTEHPEIKQPHELYSNTINNLLVPIDGAKFGSDTFSANARNYLLTGEEGDANFFLGLTKINALIEKSEDDTEEAVEDVAPGDIKLSLADAIYNITGSTFFANDITNGSLRDLDTSMKLWRTSFKKIEDTAKASEYQSIDNQESQNYSSSRQGDYLLDDYKLSNFLHLYDILVKYPSYKLLFKEFGESFKELFLQNIAFIDSRDLNRNIYSGEAFERKQFYDIIGMGAMPHRSQEQLSEEERVASLVKDVSKHIVAFDALMTEMRKILHVSFTAMASVWGMHEISIKVEGDGGSNQTKTSRINLLELLTSKTSANDYIL